MQGLKLNEKIELYRLFVETSEKLCERRLNVNKFFMAVNSALLALMPKTETCSFVLFLTLINFLWFSLIRNYLRLNRAKFSVILEIEKDLAFQPFTDEHKFRKENLGYNRFCDTESCLPIVISLFFWTLWLQAPIISFLKKTFCSC